MLASFNEAGDHLLTVFKLNIPNTLHRALLSTNAIGNTFKNLRRVIVRVTKWRSNTNQADLWLASSLRLAEKTFRRIKRDEDFPVLIQALEHADRESGEQEKCR